MLANFRMFIYTPVTSDSSSFSSARSSFASSGDQPVCSSPSNRRLLSSLSPVEPGDASALEAKPGKLGGGGGGGGGIPPVGEIGLGVKRGGLDGE